ncbi:MAG: hypothetical protein V1886_04415, partial [archaeon]
MNKKHLAVFFAALFIVLIANSCALAAYNETEETALVNKAYTWLSNSMIDGWPSGTEDISFSLLALAYDDIMATNGRTALEEASNDMKCWPSTACKIKETALAVMALSRIGQDTSAAENWLTAKNSTPSELSWYMQIDSAEKATCTIYYNQNSIGYNITIGSNKKINRAGGSCLSLSYGNYWLRIARDCYEEKFTISCDQEFVTTLFYQKPGSQTIYISSDTKRESAGGEATLGISSICLGQDGTCDYEGTAWAAVALSQTRDVSLFIPYLVGYAEANSKFMPDAFLLLLTGQEDYANALISQFKREGFWTSDSDKSKQFDTALALLALKEKAPKQKEIAKNWLLKEQAKSGNAEGSWRESKRDTGFVLYSIWPKDATYVGSEQIYCSDYGYFCMPTYDCNYDLRLTNYYCSGSDVCCESREEEILESCSEMGGSVCNYNAICSGTSENSLDGLCCRGECEAQQELSECEKASYTCRYTCEDSEESNALECTGARTCCQSKAIQKNNSLLWITLIIILAGIAIFFLASKKFKFNPKPKGASAKQNPRIFPSTPAQAKPFARTFGMGGQP